jgi:hypothetical protein
MSETLTLATFSSRKRKKPSASFSFSREDEKFVAHALHVFFRKIPSDGGISEDEIGSESDDLKEREESDQDYEDQDEKEQYEIKWSNKNQTIRVNDFNEPSGPTKTLPSGRSVKNFFELIFDRKVWHHICKQTNLYAQQQTQLNQDSDWKSLAVGELKSWVGCLIAMGLTHYPNLRMYWESPWRLSVVADRFTRDRFVAIKKYLHLADNAAIGDFKGPNADRLAKIRPLWNLLLQNFRSNYSPGRFLTVDEDMCKFKGRSVMKQYMKAKIIKWGYKIWKLCDASSAYTLNMDVYTGATEEKIAQGLAYGVTMKMMNGYLDKDHLVVMDNQFASVPLFLDLLSRDTYACGTIRPNRKFLPEEFQKQQDMAAGESKFWQSGNFVATLWQDKKLVRFLSTCCEPEGDDTVTRRRRTEDSNELPCPPVVKLYSKYMGGVDRSDRMVRTYSVSRASKKWWFRLFYYMLDTAIANSYILYNSSPNHPKITELDFVKELSLALIGSFSKKDQVQPGPQRKRSKSFLNPRVTAGNHWPVKTKKRQKCKYCARPKSKGPRSIYVCEACHVTLCIDNCFKLYHTRQQ